LSRADELEASMRSLSFLIANALLLGCVTVLAQCFREQNL